MINKVLYSILGVGMAFSVTSCEKDAGQLASFEKEGYVQLDVIVNPMIHPYAQSVSLTIDEVRLGEVISENLVPDENLVFDTYSEPLAVQVGSHAILAPGGYTNLELDFNTSGNNSSRVTTSEGVTDGLGIGANPVYTLRAEGSFLVEDGFTTKRLLLLDLNKLVQANSNGQLNFSFRENQSLSSSARHVDPKSVGQISGSIKRTEDSPRQTQYLVVYAYEIGTFNRGTEVDNGFSSAFISSNVRGNDQFTFPVLPEGAYELVVAHYGDDNEDGLLEFKELLQADSEVRSDTRMTRVSANSETTVEVSLGGVMAD